MEQDALIGKKTRGAIRIYVLFQCYDGSVMGSLYKVVVYVPVTDADKLRKVIGDAGGGKIGAYSHASFSTRGTGRFMPLHGAKPAIGEMGKPEEVEEERIEFVCETHCLDEVIMAIRKTHPYEEPAIEAWLVEHR